MKIVNCIYSRNKLDFKKYTKSIQSDDIISYYDIISKLTKNNDKNDKPSNLVVNSYIRKKIIKSISDKNTRILLYALKNLDLDTISEIKSLIEDNYDGEVEFNLIIIKHRKKSFKIDRSFEKEFNKIRFEDL